MSDVKNKFWQRLNIVFTLVAVLWVIQLLQYYRIFDFSDYANQPRHLNGLKGIIFSPLLHNPYSFDHIISNTLPILVLLTVLLNAYPRVSLPVLAFIHVLSGLMVWLLAPGNTRHVGISGIIYGIAGFLVASGLFRRDATSVAIAIFVVLVYGGMVIGFLPMQGVSWQSHLFGALSGAVIAFILRRIDLPLPGETEQEPNEPDRHFFDEVEGL